MPTPPRKQEDHIDSPIQLGNSAGLDEVSVIDRFIDRYHDQNERVQPEDFDDNLVDVALRVLSDSERPMVLRYHASIVIGKLVCISKSHIHTLIEKGALEVLVQCIHNEPPTGEFHCVFNCVSTVAAIALHCSDCNLSVRKTGVLEIIATQVLSGAVNSLQIRIAIQACGYILRHETERVLPKTQHLLVSGMAKMMRRFDTDFEILKDALHTLRCLTISSADDEEFTAIIDVIMNEDGLISKALDSISTGCQPLIKSSLALFVNMARGTATQTRLLIEHDGFMKMIAKCLDASCDDNAVLILFNITRYRNADMIIKETEIIAQLMYLMHHRDLDLQKMVCRVFANMFVELATGQVLSMEAVISNGVRVIVDTASKSGADSALMNMIREVLPKQLSTHPEFARICEAKGYGNASETDFEYFKKHYAEVLQDVAGSVGSVFGSIAQTFTALGEGHAHEHIE